MQQHDLTTFLSTFAAERLAVLQRLEAAARVVSHYDFNNTYQYVISRQETQVAWVQNALAEFGAPLPSPAATLPAPEAPKVGKKVDVGAYRGILEDDAKHLGSFVARWQSRVDEMSHARHRLMLNVILGESKEHQRLFEQAAAGFEDVLGKRTPNAARVGAVLPTRWME